MQYIGTGEVIGGVSELSFRKLKSGEPAFRSIFDGSMSSQEAISNMAFALGNKGLGKLNGVTAIGSSGLNKKIIGANNFLIGSEMYGAAATNGAEIQKKQK